MFWFVVGALVGGIVVGFFMTWVMGSEFQMEYDRGWEDGRKVRESEERDKPL